ncbi:MAG: AAA family ATPase [Ruminococcus sp.]|nr:AAA family ATPase [Ruminococcus sp.]MCM1380868.1 AAA family ATPase [Muribaculaceae bacterium]MCM1480793.1 AAA family ATPase [Muribaculaceae bacterium]
MNEHCRYIEEIRLNKPLPRRSYLSGLTAVKSLAAMEGLSFGSDVTFLVGENGSGKSTLLEAIAVAAGFNPEGGSKNFSFGTYDSHSELSQYLTLSRGAHPRDGFFLRAESLYNAATYIDEIEKLPASGSVIEGYGGTSLHEQSHGESFLAVIKNRFFGNGLYILDEPEAALSPTGIMSLMAVMHRLTEKNSQFIISTHSPILMTYPGALIYELTESGIRRTNYKDTGHYIITKRFLESPEKMLEELFK